MSSLMEGLREPRPRSRFLWWWQHHPWTLALVDISLWTPSFMISGWGQWPFTVLAVLFAGLMMLSVKAHQRAMLCPGCSFSHLPDDPDVQVKRHRRRLRFFHRFGDFTMIIHARLARHRMWLTELIVIGVWLIIWDMLIIWGMVPTGPHSSVPVGLIVAILIGAWMSTVGITHNRLVTWCPWCKDNGGGDDVSMVEPDPDPSDAIDPTPVLVSQ